VIGLFGGVSCSDPPSQAAAPAQGQVAAAPSLAQARALPPVRPCEPRRDLPAKSYWNKPEAAFEPSDYVAHFRHMEAFYDAPGELGFIAEGERLGFESLSFIVTETQPSGGPPLHVHDTEEAHVLLEGEVEYQIGDRRFHARGPYVARVPAGVAHTFANRGDCPFNLIAVFPSKKLSYIEVGANPLVPGAPAPAETPVNP
jgi:mannose-6-phosphate isomerase-like protein (cupin superfamily)